MENCPECGSSDWRLASIIYQEGTAAIETKSQGSVKLIGVGTGGVGVGLGRQTLQTQGTQQTISASMVSPPEKPKPLVQKTTKEEFQKNQVLAGMFFGALLTYGAFHEGPLLGIFVLIVCFVGFSSMKKNQDKAYSDYLTEYENSENTFKQESEKYNEWLKTRVCQRCGAKFNDSGTVTGNIAAQAS